MSVDVAYVGAKGSGGYAWVDSTCRRRTVAGAQSRPYFISNRTSAAIQSWGQRLDTEYNSLQIALNKSFTKGFMFKGAYTLSKSMNESDNDGRTGLTWEHPLELARNWALAGFDRTHNFQIGFACALPWQSTGSYERRDAGGLRRLAVERHLRRVQRHALYDDGQRHRVQHARHEADRQHCRRLQDDRRSSAPAGCISTRRQFSQPGAVQGNTGRNQFRGPGAWNADLALFRSFAMGGSRRLEFRFQGNNIFNHAVFANPVGNFNDANFGRIVQVLGGGALTNSVYIERQLQLGVRFQF